MKTIQKLLVSKSKCIGCRACSSTCPAGIVNLIDKDDVRTIEFALTCIEDCRRCAEVCSEDAIKLKPASKLSKKRLTIQFALIACAECGTPFTTEPMLNKVRSSILAALKPVEPFWAESCICCRQKNTAVQQVGKKKAVG